MKNLRTAGQAVSRLELQVGHAELVLGPIPFLHVWLDFVDETPCLVQNLFVAASYRP